MSRLLIQIPILLVCSEGALAAEPYSGRTEIQWQSIQGCPTESELKALVEERLGQPLDSPREQSLVIHAEVKRTTSGEFQVDLWTTGASGTGRRQISNADCEKLTQAASLVMAIAIDPTRVRELSSIAPGAGTAAPASSEPNVTPTVSPSTGSNVAPTISPAPLPQNWLQPQGRIDYLERPTRRLPAHDWSVAARTFVGTGTLPAIDWGLMATAGYFPMPSLELRAGAGGFLPRSAPVTGSNNGSMTVSAGFVDTSVCAVPLRGTWQTSVCAGVQMGLMQAEGNNLTNEHRKTAAYGTAVMDFGYGYRFGSGFGVVGSVTVGLGILRPQFGVTRNGALSKSYQPDSGVMRFGLGVFWDLP